MSTIFALYFKLALTWLSKKTTLNLSLPVDVQEMMTPRAKSLSVIVSRKKCAFCRSTVPLTVCPQTSCSTGGSSKPGTFAAPEPMCCAAVKTFWVISVGTGIPALDTWNQFQHSFVMTPILKSWSTFRLPTLIQINVSCVFQIVNIKIEIVTRAPKRRPIVPNSSTLMEPKSLTEPSSPWMSYCRRLFGSERTA